MNPTARKIQADLEEADRRGRTRVQLEEIRKLMLPDDGALLQANVAKAIDPNKVTAVLSDIVKQGDEAGAAADRTQCIDAGQRSTDAAARLLRLQARTGLGATVIRRDLTRNK